MRQSSKFGVHWQHDGKAYYDEVRAESAAAAAEYFNEHKRDDVTLERVEPVRSNEGGVGSLLTRLFRRSVHG